MELDTVVAVAELALERNAIDDVGVVTAQLRGRGWRSAPIGDPGSVLDREWRHEHCWGLVHTGAAGERAFIGLNANYTDEADARALLRHIGDRIGARVAAGELRHVVEEDETWTRWSDGHRDVELRVHAAVPAQSIPWGVQFSVERPTTDPA